MNQKECTLTGGNSTPEEVAVTEIESQGVQIPNNMTDQATANETERFCALVQVMLHYTTSSTAVWKRTCYRQHPERHRRELEHPHRQQKRSHPKKSKNRHQGLEHYCKKLECACQ